MSIREQITDWCNRKGLRFVDNVGYTFSVCDNIDIVQSIRVRECRKYTYIYLPMPTNAPYKYRYQMKIEKGCAYLLRYLFK